MKKILLLLSILIGTANAWAGTCEERLGNLFTPNQRVQLCKGFGSAINNALVPSATNTYDLGTSSLRWKNGYFGTSVFNSATTNSFMAGLTAASGDVGNISGAQIFTFSTGSTQGLDIIQASADTLGASSYWFKTRKTDGTADTIVNSGDTLGRLRFYGADGVDFQRAAEIVVTSDATPGAGDMPGAIDFQTTPDGSTTPASALKLTNSGTALFGGTGTIGWTVTSIQANTACSSRCTYAAVMGFGLTTDSAFPITSFVDGSSATADICLCAGPS